MCLISFCLVSQQNDRDEGNLESEFKSSLRQFQMSSQLTKNQNEQFCFQNEVNIDGTVSVGYDLLSKLLAKINTSKRSGNSWEAHYEIDQRIIQLGTKIECQWIQAIIGHYQREVGLLVRARVYCTPGTGFEACSYTFLFALSMSNQQ